MKKDSFANVLKLNSQLVTRGEGLTRERKQNKTTLAFESIIKSKLWHQTW